MDSALDWHTAKALLDWQVDLGVTEAICDAPVNRYEEAAKAPAKPAKAAATVQPHAKPAEPDGVQVAMQAVARVTDLESLQAAMAAFDLCDLKKGARNLVFADGRPEARVMIVGEAPGRDEDRDGKPFVGQAGHLLDKMLAAIGLSRTGPDAEAAVYITNVLPWRPPQNRDPRPDEVAMMLPFLRKHVELVDPDVLLLMGNHSCQALLNKQGITKLRGSWEEVLGRPALPMFHPGYLLRNPMHKREAWHDLLMVQARLRGEK